MRIPCRSEGGKPHFISDQRSMTSINILEVTARCVQKNIDQLLSDYLVGFTEGFAEGFAEVTLG